jgi:hypothetical protein
MLAFFEGFQSLPACAALKSSKEDEYGTEVKSYSQRKPELVGEKSVIVPLFSLQNSHEVVEIQA